MGLPDMVAKVARAMRAVEGTMRAVGLSARVAAENIISVSVSVIGGRASGGVESTERSEFLVTLTLTTLSSKINNTCTHGSLPATLATTNPSERGSLAKVPVCSRVCSRGQNGSRSMATRRPVVSASARRR